jgi:hypothetical protein
MGRGAVAVEDPDPQPLKAAIRLKSVRDDSNRFLGIVLGNIVKTQKRNNKGLNIHHRENEIY